MVCAFCYLGSGESVVLLGCGLYVQCADKTFACGEEDCRAVKAYACRSCFERRIGKRIRTALFTQNVIDAVCVCNEGFALIVNGKVDCVFEIAACKAQKTLPRAVDCNNLALGQHVHVRSVVCGGDTLCVVNVENLDGIACKVDVHAVFFENV